MRSLAFIFGALSCPAALKPHNGTLAKADHHNTTVNRTEVQVDHLNVTNHNDSHKIESRGIAGKVQAATVLKSSKVTDHTESHKIESRGVAAKMKAATVLKSSKVANHTESHKIESRGVAAKVQAATVLKSSKVPTSNATVNFRVEQSSEAKHKLSKTSSSTKVKEGCGLLSSFPNAKPKNYRDARKTKYDTEKKKQVENVFMGGDVVNFKCEPGFTADGSKDGDTEFEVECLDKGFFEAKAVCSKASKCGKLPEIPSAAPTGKSSGGKVEYACIKGYSLDGEAVVAGGKQANSHFEVKCVDFKGKYDEFSGKCQAYAFVPATETIRMYNQVFKALFTVSCKGTLKKEFGKCGDEDCAPPAGLDSACAKISHGDNAGDKTSQCGVLVTKIKQDFKAKETQRENFDKEKKRDKKWFEDDINEDRPHLNDEATRFCTDLFDVLKV